MKRLAVIVVVACSGCGGHGHSSTPTPTPTPAASLLSVTPVVGSPRTRFTITGSDLPGAPSSTQVLFNGVPASVLAVTTGATPTIVVQATAYALTEAQPVDVTVNGSNPIAITLEPSGTRHPLDAPVFSAPTSLSQASGVIYLVDPNGAWSADISTREIRAIARSFEDGWNRITGVWALSDGSVCVADVSAAPLQGRLFRRTASGTWANLAILSASIDAVALDPATGNLFFTNGVAVDELLAGTGLPSHLANLGEAAGDAVFQSSKLFFTQPGANKIVTVNPVGGAVTDFQVALVGASALAGDGANLYTVVGTTIDELDSVGTVTPFFSNPSLNVARSRLARASGGDILASGNIDALVYDIASGATSLTAVLGGVQQGLAVARAPGEFLISGGFTAGCGQTSDAANGAFLIGARDDGTAHIVSEKACVVPQAQVLGGTLYYVDSFARVASLDLASGAITSIATTANGFSLSISVAADSDGTVYVGYFDNAGAGPAHIGSVSAAGVVNLHLADISSGGAVSLTVSGDRLWFARITPNGGFPTDVDVVPIGGGTPEIVAAIQPAFDSLIPDGEGGVYAADSFALGGLWHLFADGSAQELSPGATGPALSALEQDPLTGEIYATSVTSPEAWISLDP